MDFQTLLFTLLNLIILIVVFFSFAMNREYVILILGTTSVFVLAMVISFNIIPFFSKHRHYELLNRRVGKYKKNVYLFMCVSLVSLSWILVYTQNNIGIVKFISFLICLPWLIYVLKYHTCTNEENNLDDLSTSILNKIDLNESDKFVIEGEETNILEKGQDDETNILEEEQNKKTDIPNHNKNAGDIQYYTESTNETTIS